MKLQKITFLHFFAIAFLLSACHNSNGKDYSYINNDSTLNAVDLGLSVKWANMNLGADCISDFGGYYPITEDTTAFLDPNWADTTSAVCLQYDVAHKYLGGKWRLPTQEEMEELIYKCKWTWGKLDNTEGAFVEGPNGNVIFLPAAGDEEAKYGDHLFAVYRISSIWDSGSSFLLGFSKPEKGTLLYPELNSDYETDFSYTPDIEISIGIFYYGAQIHYSVRGVCSK